MNEPSDTGQMPWFIPPMIEDNMPPKAPQPRDPGATPAASTSVSKAIVTLYMLLDGKDDRARKTYRYGYDDARAARETGLSEACVREHREHDFGPIADNTADDLIAALARISDSATQMVQMTVVLSEGMRSQAGTLEHLTSAVDEAYRLARLLTAAPVEKAT